MAKLNYYRVLEISPQATQTEIKSAYRRLAKKFHPDSQKETANHDRIIRINEAYEVLGDPQKRRGYDRTLSTRPTVNRGASRTPSRRSRRTARSVDFDFQRWLQQVYQPVNDNIDRIFKPFKRELDNLSGDPFDDELMADFQDYIETCREILAETQTLFRSTPNPANIAGVAAHLYYCLNHIGDGIEELNLFTLNYDDSYLHAGQEFFRIADGLRREARAEMNQFF